MVPFPKPKFPLRTASKERPSLELYTGTEKPEPRKKFRTPRLGPLGVIFLVLRLCIFGFLIATLALFANGMNRIAATHQARPPAEILGGITVSTIACIYVVTTFILYQVNWMPHLLTGIIDTLFFIASIVVAALLGKRFPKLNCGTLLPTKYDLATHLKHNQNKYSAFVTFDKQSCNDSKAVWGIYIALCLLFLVSAPVCVALWNRVRRDSKKGPVDLDA
ncbi:hypothetical protein QBC38DRAFT_372649 [Podospora fimiseda]|uniref:MARVEL domain-containing protein n=1 Tax=Podospora fimiseda TaxID=252190 RepID=A0AAN7GSQ8_9PEZI|nr:hypothetical protein QBC38DRAFT_372649 [Podospora fimiseda]